MLAAGIAAVEAASGGSDWGSGDLVGGDLVGGDLGEVGEGMGASLTGWSGGIGPFSRHISPKSNQ